MNGITVDHLCLFLICIVVFLGVTAYIKERLNKKGP